MHLWGWDIHHELLSLNDKQTDIHTVDKEIETSQGRRAAYCMLRDTPQVPGKWCGAFKEDGEPETQGDFKLVQGHTGSARWYGNTGQESWHAAYETRMLVKSVNYNVPHSK